MDMHAYPAALQGIVPAIPSKSHAHRALICAALARGKTEVILPATSRDMDATVRCLRALGAEIRVTDAGFVVKGIVQPPEHAALHCGESGSTLRFLLPVAAALCGKTDFSGAGRLPQRPLAPLTEQMEAHGAAFSGKTLPLTVTKLQTGGVFQLPGNVSSQYITGLLLAAPLLSEEVEIEISGVLESSPYVEITIGVMRDFGVEVEKVKDGFRVPPGQTYRTPGLVRIEGDWSNAAFFLAAGALCGDVACSGLSADSPQGDRAILRILRDMGAEIEMRDGTVRCQKSRLRGIQIDGAGIPDLVPILAVCAAGADGTTELRNVERLRLKESDRLEAVLNMLHVMGIRADTDGKSLFVTGGRLSGGSVDGVNDHRIVMSAAIAAAAAAGPSVILDAQAADKSYPGFWDDYRRIGGCANVI